MKGRGVGVAVWRVGMAGGCVGSEFEVGWSCGFLFGCARDPPGQCVCVVHRCYIDVSDTPESELMGVKIFFRGLVHCSLSGGLGKRKTTFRPRGAWRPSGPPASLYLPSSQAKPRPHRAGARAPAFASEKRLRCAGVLAIPDRPRPRPNRAPIRVVPTPRTDTVRKQVRGMGAL